MIGRFRARERPEGQDEILSWSLGSIKNGTGDPENPPKYSPQKSGKSIFRKITLRPNHLASKCSRKPLNKPLSHGGSKLQYLISCIVRFGILDGMEMTKRGGGYPSAMSMHRQYMPIVALMQWSPCFLRRAIQCNRRA